MRLDLLESQSLQYLLAVHATRYVGLVGEYQQTGTRETLSSWSVSRIYCAPAKGAEKTTNLLLEQPVQLLLAVVYPQPVGGVDHPDERVRLLKVVSPV